MRVTMRLNSESVTCYLKSYKLYKEKEDGVIVNKENESKLIMFKATELDEDSIKSQYQDVMTGFKMETGSRSFITVYDLDYKTGDKVIIDGVENTIVDVFSKPLYNQLGGMRNRAIRREYILVLT